MRTIQQQWGRSQICIPGGTNWPSKGPGFGYFANPFKTWLIAKQGYHADTISSIAGTGVNITPEGRPYLGTAIGSQEYVEAHVELKVNEWLSCVNQLAEIAKTQLHAAFAALTHGLMSKWTYSCI